MPDRLRRQLLIVARTKISKGHSALSCKNTFLEKFKITARQFNACRVSVEGKIEACKASQKLSLVNLNQQIEALDSQIQRLEKKPSKHFWHYWGLVKKKIATALAAHFQAMKN